MLKKIKNIYYIADLNLSTLKAYTIHVMKMIDNFNYFADHVELLVYSQRKNFTLNKIKKIFILLSKKNFFIKNFFTKPRNSFFYRIVFGYLSANYLKKKNGLVITRSFMASLFLILFKKKHFLEIHHNLKGLTRFMFLNLNLISSNSIIKIIFITKSLKKNFNNYDIKSLVLPDAVELKNFKRVKIRSKIKNIVYVGSFYKGRGIDLILKIAEKLKDKNFFLYGKRKTDLINSDYKKLNNVKVFNLIKYSEVPSKLAKADLFLMPYSLDGIFIDALGNNDISKFTSPMKMFEYLASGAPLISSNIPVLKEILIHKKNCLISKDNSLNTWVKNIQLVEADYQLRNKIIKNALISASKNTWFLRANKIVNEYLRFS
jgi:glycosyltransferase involved in cell wall biosynthesis